MLRLWIGRALLWLLLPAQIEQAQRAGKRQPNGAALFGSISEGEAVRVSASRP
jgi:hypothetical protein